MSATLTDVEALTLRAYERNASAWADACAPRDFWAAELRAFSRMLPAPGGVLDIGSGHGRDARILAAAGHPVTGIDISRELLKLARANCPQARFLHASMYELPFEDESFDGALMVASLLHVPKDRAQLALREARRVLRAGARLLVVVKQGEGERLENGPHGQRFFAYYTAAELRRALSDAGFHAVETPLQDVVTDVHPIRRAGVERSLIAFDH